MRTRVVLTGIGMLTACGRGWQPFWEAACEGRSSVQELRGMHLNGFPSRFAGQVREDEPRELIRQRKSIKVMSRDIQLAVAASELAVQDAGLVMSQSDPERVGLVIGAGAPINSEVEELGAGIRPGFDAEGRFQMARFGGEGIRALFPLWFLKYIPNMPACHVGIAHGLRGPSNTITTSAASAVQAIGEACRILERGDADVMLAGGTDSELNPIGLSRLHMLGLLSRQSASAAGACRPFDRSRDGLVMGEGAGLVVLETQEHAQRRGARIYAEILGYGCAADPESDPRRTVQYQGKKKSILRALRDAGLEPRDIDGVIANGSGLPDQDRMEARALAEVFAAHPDVPVTGLKPVAGHTMFAAGGIDVSAAALALRDGRFPPLQNLQAPDSECPLAFVRGKTVAAPLKKILVNACGLTGQNASLVLGASEG